ncbi:MAG: endo-1,4-beta-xylanase, partial [Calditrichaeota bacterium]|nr:endo-1,4-beta-xylanase [Calditrichota bacterium]
SLTRTFRIGGRETGLEIDRLAFGRADLYFTVGNLDNGEPGSEDPPGGGTEQDPLATGHSKWLGCAYSAAQAPQFENYWNQVTPENAGKWGSVEPSRDAMNWGGMDQAYNFAKNNGFPIRYHVLIWGNQQPSWIENLSETEQLAEIEEFFQAVANRYPDIDYLEVVNEPLHDPPDGRGNGNYINALGGYNNLYGTGHDWIIRAFELARQYFPDSTKLMINDYSIINDNNATTQYLNIINSLVSRDLIDGIGVQGHAFSTRGSVNTMVSNLTRLGNTGLPIQICEMDIDGQTDAVQLADYQRLIPPIWEHPAVEGITLWGWRPGLWRNDQRAFLIDENGDERPALVWLREYLRSTVGIGDPLPAAPAQFRLHQNFPNPFNPETRITYDIAHPARVTLIVYDILGRQVATLVDRHQGAGRYSVPFRAGHLASGIYFYRLHTGSFEATQKMMLVR